MKAKARLSVILFTLSLVLIAILAPVSIIATRDVYYVNQFKKIGLYPEEGESITVKYIGGNSENTAEFTAQQMDDIIAHITAFMSNKKDSFALKLDGVMLNGTKTDGVDIFGEEAITHMEDVVPAFAAVNVGLLLCSTVALVCGIFMLLKKSDVRPYIFKYSLGVVIGIFSAAALFLGTVLIIHLSKGGATYFDTLWEILHHVFFPFSPDKFSGSFFNDTLTMLLTSEFFMNTVVTVVINIIALTAAWLFSAKLISKR